MQMISDPRIDPATVYEYYDLGALFDDKLLRTTFALRQIVDEPHVLDSSTCFLRVNGGRENGNQRELRGIVLSSGSCPLRLPSLRSWSRWLVVSVRVV